MDLKKAKIYPSKILLFGEYLVLNGGQALAYPNFDYSLSPSVNVENTNQKFFISLVDYISKLERFQSRISSQFRLDIQNGLHFDSSIPIGYGLGSSGALTAAIYDRYIEVKPLDLREIKAELAEIESFFHDKSSGIDPLTSYLQKPIWIKGDDISVMEEKPLDRFYLYDSGIKRNAKQAISHFNMLSKDSDFKHSLDNLRTISDSMISNWNDGKEISKEMKEYSALQLSLLSDFIPISVRRVWENGLSTNTYYMKLCGAGMGGFYLKYKL